MVRDPWAVPRPHARPGPRWARWIGVVLAVPLGAAGVAGVLWHLGPGGQRSAPVLLAVAAAWSLLVATQSPVRWWGPPAAIVVAAAGAARTIPWSGRAPIVLVLVGTTAAHVALADWAPRSGRRAGRVASVSVPVLVVAQVVAYRHAPTAVVAPLLLAGTALVAWERLRPEHFAVPERALARGARTVGTAAVHVVLFIVALPLLYLPGAIARGLGWLARLGHRAPARWGPPSSTASQHRDVRRPFSSPPRQVAIVRHLASLAVVAVVVGVVVARDPGDRRGGEDPTFPVATTSPDGSGRSIADRLDRVPFSRRPALSDVPFADQLQAETYAVQLVPDEVTGYAVADRVGELVNVRGGRRLTAGSACTACPEVEVVLVGGSLVFGIGQRDGHTIGSELVAIGDRAGLHLDITTIAVPGWTLDQEQAAVAAHLRTNADRPQIVVFLDGYNDTLATLMDLLFEGRVPDRPARLDPDKAGQLLEADGFGEFPAARYGQLAARRYEDEAASFDRSLRDRGIASVRFFQPDASSSPVQRAGVDALEVLPADFYETTQMDRVLGAAAARLDRDGRATDLRDAIDEEDDPVFIDTAHVDERGAVLIAAALFDELEGRLRDLAR